MIDKEQLVEQRWNARNKKYYVSLGYTYTKMGDPFMVKYTDLTPSSTALIKIVCDHCGKEMYIPRLRYERYLSKELGDYCGDCKHIKAMLSNEKTYGTPYISQLESVQKKRRETCLRKYGETTNLKAEETKQRIRQTCLEKYGVENIASSPQFRKRLAEANIKKYGVDNPFKSPEVQHRIKETVLRKYGVENVSQHQELRAKAMASFNRKYGMKSSKQQDAVFDMLLDMYGNCELNKIVDYYSIDCFVVVEGVPIDVEYDGWYWHKDQKSADNRRDGYMYSKGYRVIRIKGNNKIPTKEQLIKAIDTILDGERYAEIKLDWKD